MKSSKTFKAGRELLCLADFLYSQTVAVWPLPPDAVLDRIKGDKSFERSRSEAGQDLSNFGCLRSRLLHLDVRSLGGKSLMWTQEESSLLTYRGALAFFSYQK